jgi:hypothetical protein
MVFSTDSDPRLYKERGSRNRIGKLGQVLESRQSKAIEEEMARRLHSDLK